MQSDLDFDHSTVAFTNQHDYTAYLMVGTTAVVTCDPLYRQAAGDSEFVCARAGDWIGEDTVCQCKCRI